MIPQGNLAQLARLYENTSEIPLSQERSRRPVSRNFLRIILGGQMRYVYYQFAAQVGRFHGHLPAFTMICPGRSSACATSAFQASCY